GAAAGGAGAARSISRYLHVVDEVVLTEDVTSDGVHTFGLGRRDRLKHFLEEFLVPPDAPAAPPDGARPVTPTAADPLPAALGGPTVLGEATVLHAAADGGPDVLTAALGPGGCFLGRSADDEPPVLLPVGAGDVVHGVLGEIRAAGEAVSRAVGDRS